MRRHKRLARDWTQRTFGRRTSLYFWIVYTAIVLVVLNTTSAHATNAINIKRHLIIGLALLIRPADNRGE